MFHLAVVFSMPADSVRTPPADFWAGAWCVVERKTGCRIAFPAFLLLLCFLLFQSAVVFFHLFRFTIATWSGFGLLLSLSLLSVYYNIFSQP